MGRRVDGQRTGYQRPAIQNIYTPKYCHLGVHSDTTPGGVTQFPGTPIQFTSFVPHDPVNHTSFQSAHNVFQLGTDNKYINFKETGDYLINANVTFFLDENPVQSDQQVSVKFYRDTSLLAQSIGSITMESTNQTHVHVSVNTIVKIDSTATDFYFFRVFTWNSNTRIISDDDGSTSRVSILKLS